MSFENKKSIFEVEMDYEEMVELPDGYAGLRLSDLNDGEIYVGSPQITGIQTVEFEETDPYGSPIFDENGEPKTKIVHKIRLVITNEDEESYLDININLKSKDTVVKQVRKGSVLFDFIQSILELENKGSTEGMNIFRNVNLEQFIDFIKELKTLGIKNIERNGTWSFNSFYVVQVNGKKADK